MHQAIHQGLGMNGLGSGDRAALCGDKQP